MTRAIARFWRDERGMEEVEIGIVASLIVLIGALVFIAIGNDSETILGALQTATGAAAGS